MAKIEVDKICTFRLTEPGALFSSDANTIVGNVNGKDVWLHHWNKEGKELLLFVFDDPSIEFITGKVSDLIEKPNHYEIHLYDDENFKMF